MNDLTDTLTSLTDWTKRAKDLEPGDWYQGRQITSVTIEGDVVLITDGKGNVAELAADMVVKK